MPGDPKAPDDGFKSLELARRINDRCERFERDWRNGRSPRIEEYLELADAGDRSSLFRELLPLELELRHERGENPGLVEYQQRFPDLADAVTAAFVELSTVGPSSDATVDWNPSTIRRTTDDERVSPIADSRSRTGIPPQSGSGDRFGDYELLEEIARGGMGVVYKARHVELKRLVALKMILSGSMATAAERERFRREAELAANLDHPHIVPIYEVREQDGLLYFTMKLVDGGNLAEKVTAFMRDHRSAARLMATLARTIHYAHGQGFVHCDLKPSNVLIDHDGQPQITDFGLAKRADEDSSLTATGAILGSPSYMAPEQASGQRKSLGPATDVYGLGAILYELLVGRPPFRSPSIMETVVQVLERDPVPPRELQPSIPRELETICLKCLEKLPDDRYPSALALAEDLERFLAGEVINATTVFHRLRRWSRREPELVARLGGLGLVALWTQVNYAFLTPEPRFRLHYTVQAVVLLWAVSAAVFQALWRMDWGSDRLRLVWSATDVLFLSVELYLLERVESTLLVGYPLLIAASGLWCRVSLVWFTTMLTIVAYAVLHFHSVLAWNGGLPTWKPQAASQYPNIFISALVITGFVVARQVKRILALSQYFEHRQNA